MEKILTLDIHPGSATLDLQTTTFSTVLSQNDEHTTSG
jgi:hypothetical protein